MKRNRKTVVIIVAILLIVVVCPAFIVGNKAIADTTGSTSIIPIDSAEFVIGMNQYFVNNQTPGISMDAAAYIDSTSGRTLVPVRYLGNALGAQTAWDGNTQEVAVTTTVYNIAMTIGSTTLTVNGQAQAMDVAPVIKNGRTYLPARWVANALGYQVDWNSQYQIVIIWPNGTPEPSLSNNVIAQAQQKPTVVNGFNIPVGTSLTVSPPSPETTNPKGDYPAIIDFQIDGSKGNVQEQIADTQNILSQTQYMDPATVAKAMAVINNLTTIQSPTWSDFGLFNSPNGGCVTITSTAFGMNKGYCMIDVQIFRQHESFPNLPAE